MTDVAKRSIEKWDIKTRQNRIIKTADPKCQYIEEGHGLCLAWGASSYLSEQGTAAEAFLIYSD